jgi:hypothetical protein
VASIVGGTTVTVSAYVKAAGRNFFVIVTSDQAGTFRTSYFDLANGTLGTVASGHTASITAVGNGWYRCAITQAQSATTGVFTYYPSLAAVNGSTSYQGDGNSGVYIYGAQLSDSASLDPYVPTPGAAPSSTAYYGPRFDYDPVTLAPKGILVEEARTNLLLQSQTFGTSPWFTNNATITANTTVAPDGTTTASKLVEDTSNNLHRVAQVPTLTAVPHTATIYAKPAGRNWIYIANASLSQAAYFNVSTGVIGTVVGATTATIAPAGNGWYRCSITSTPSAAAQNYSFYTANADLSFSYTGDGTSGLFLWGAQLEAGAFATSYIPTIASTVTRSADVATITGSLFSQWYGQSEGTLLTKFVPTNSIANNTRSATITDGTNRVVDIYIDVNVWRSFNGTTNVTPASSTAVLNSTVNFASAYKSGDYAASMNGSAVGTAATAGVQSSNKLTLGANITSSAGFLNGHIQSIQYYPVRAADFQLQALTT